MARVKSTIDFFEGVPIPTDFKHSPIFNSKAAQKAFFNKYKNDSLTFEGSYQRVEEQIKTSFKYEQLRNVNYVHIKNPSYSNSPADKHEWWGFVMDIHYINDCLVIVDWVVDPIQTFMFDWDLGKAFIERGMMRSHVVNNSRPETLYAINDKKISVFTNPEPVGVDGAAYYLDHDNLMRVSDDIESRITYMVILIGDSENRSLVGSPSQTEYYVLPYDKVTGKLFDFEIRNVKTRNDTITIKSDRNWRYNINDSIDAIARDLGLTKGGQAVQTGYLQNEIGLDFEPVLDDETGRYTLIATMHNREWRVSTKNTANIEVYDVLSKKVDGDDDDNNGGGDDGGNDGGSGGTGDYKEGDITNSGYTISSSNINNVLKYARQRNLMPSFLLAQMFIESHWGHPDTSIVGSVDNNWSGISEPFSPPSGVTVTRGSARPSNEGGYYVHFSNLDDYFNCYCFILSNANGLYKCEGKTTLDSFVRGLFVIGGASADYAASGYTHYIGMMEPTYNAIKNQNPGKLEKLDQLL